MNWQELKEEFGKAAYKRLQYSENGDFYVPTSNEYVDDFLGYKNFELKPIAELFALDIERAKI